MDAATCTIIGIAIGFPLGAIWYRTFRRECTHYRVPVREVVTVAAVRFPRPGPPCHDLHGMVPLGGRCWVCAGRIVGGAR